MWWASVFDVSHPERRKRPSLLEAICDLGGFAQQHLGKLIADRFGGDAAVAEERRRGAVQSRRGGGQQDVLGPDALVAESFGEGLGELE